MLGAAAAAVPVLCSTYYTSTCPPHRSSSSSSKMQKPWLCASLAGLSLSNMSLCYRFPCSEITVSATHSESAAVQAGSPKVYISHGTSDQVLNIDFCRWGLGCNTAYAIAGSVLVITRDCWFRAYWLLTVAHLAGLSARLPAP
jgi:hypothetical protein